MAQRYLAALCAALALRGASAQSVRDVYDCSMRSLAVEYAAWLQPLRSAQVFSDIADALDGTPEKAAGCSVHASEALRAAAANATATSRFPLLHAPARLPGAGGQTFYVSLSGSDANPGTMAKPFATLGAAVAASRATPGWDTILLRAGTYYGVPTTVLTAADSGLTIQNFPGEEVWLSGATPLVGVTWAPYKVRAEARLHARARARTRRGARANAPCARTRPARERAPRAHQLCSRAFRWPARPTSGSPT